MFEILMRIIHLIVSDIRIFRIILLIWVLGFWFLLNHFRKER